MVLGHKYSILLVQSIACPLLAGLLWYIDPLVEYFRGCGVSHPYSFRLNNSGVRWNPTSILIGNVQLYIRSFLLWQHNIYVSTMPKKPTSSGLQRRHTRGLRTDTCLFPRIYIFEDEHLVFKI